MNINSDDENPPSPSVDIIESPPKRMRLENSTRKSWSMMDQKTDTALLQEMGLRPLEPEETDDSLSMHKANLKRKRDIENVNPNINSNVSSPKKRVSPKCQNKMCSPSPGPSRVRSPRSNDKTKPLQPTETYEPVLGSYLVEEETPSGQSVSASYAYGCSSVESTATTTGKKAMPFLPQEPINKLVSTGDHDSFGNLPDEVILGVLRWLPKRTLANCMLVCKRWHRLACDETLWQRLDLGNKTLSKNAIGRILNRKPVIVRLASSDIGEWHPSAPLTPSRIQYLDLSMCSIDHLTLENLLECCPALRKLSLESLPLSVRSQELIGKCTNMETLNLTMAQGITDVGLAAILQGCTGLQSLNISWCALNESAVQVLVSTLTPNISRLNISGTRILTDELLSALCARCVSLVELDVSDCPALAAAALPALRPLRRLQHLALSRCYLLPPHALPSAGSLSSLRYLDVFGMLPPSSLASLRAALPAVQLNQFTYSAVARPTVGTRRTSIWGLRTRD